MDLNTNIAEDDNLFDMFDVIFEFWNYILSYLKDHYLVLTLTLLIFLLLISLFLYYNKIKNTKNFWSNFQIFISKHKSLSVLLFSLLLVISMIPSGIVNFISNSNNNGDPLILFIISGSVGIIILVIGLFLITPLLSFRFKYSFINEYDVENAKFINNIYRIFNNLRLSTKGIISVQLFEITELTYLDNINFNFKELFTLKEKRAKVSAFSPIKVDMPIPFFDFISKLNVEQDLDTNFFKQLSNHNIIKEKQDK